MKVSWKEHTKRDIYSNHKRPAIFREYGNPELPSNKIDVYEKDSFFVFCINAMSIYAPSPIGVTSSRSEQIEQIAIAENMFYISVSQPFSGLSKKKFWRHI